METGFKFVAADLTTRFHGFSYLDALRTGEWLVASNPTKHVSPCPRHEGDGLCVAHTVNAACSGGQSASSAVGLIVEYERRGILAEGEGKTRVRRLRVVDVFDPLYLIRTGLCANLYRANLSGANLYGANLSRADLYGANLSGADLRSANLYRADLRRANLGGANLYGVDLAEAYLRCANLSGARLPWADLLNADLDGTDLTGADLRNTFNVPASAVGGIR